MWYLPDDGLDEERTLGGSVDVGDTGCFQCLCCKYKNNVYK